MLSENPEPLITQSKIFRRENIPPVFFGKNVVKSMVVILSVSEGSLSLEQIRSFAFAQDDKLVTQDDKLVTRDDK